MNEMSESFGPSRETAVTTLRRKAGELRDKANGLQQLADQLDAIQAAAKCPDGGEDGPHIAVGSPAEVVLWEMAQAIR